MVDDIVRSLAALGALPQDPKTCLALASRCWDPAAAQAPFQCWLASAPYDEVLTQATSAPFTVRALALQAVTQGLSPLSERISLPIARANASAPAVSRAPLEGPTRDRLLTSLVETLSQPISGRPAPGTLSHSTVAIARDALWDATGRDMGLALTVAGRITPVSGRYSHEGRFGTFVDLAARDRDAYAAHQRPGQLLAAGGAAILVRCSGSSGPSGRSPRG